MQPDAIQIKTGKERGALVVMHLSERWWKLLVMVILLLILTAVGCETKTEKSAQLLAIGDRHLAEAQPMEALKAYRSALLLEPGNALVHYAIGKAHLVRKETWQAYTAFQAALELDGECDRARLESGALLAAAGHGQEAFKELGNIRIPAAFQPRFGIVQGRALAALGRFSEAAEVLEAVFDADQNAEIQSLLVVCFRGMGKPDALERAARRWRELDDKAPSPPLLLAQIAAGRGDKNQAERELQALIEAHPGEAAFALLRARTLEELGMAEAADLAYTQLPEESAMVRARADFALRRGRREAAVSILETFLKGKPADVESLVALVRILTATGQWTAALARLEETATLDLPKADRDQLLLTKASLMADRQEWSGAENICTQLLNENEMNLDAHQLLGTVLLNSGRPSDAEKHLDEAARARPGDASVQMMLARSQLAGKKENAAIETLRSALRTNPGHLQLRLELVQVALARKELDFALRILDQGLESKPAEPKLLRLRGQIKAARGDAAGAEGDLQQLVKVAPNVPEGYVEMGRLMLRQGKSDQAIPWFREALNHGDGWQTALPHLLATYLSKKDLKSALTLAETEATRRPDSALAHFLLAQVRAEAKDEGKAVESFSRAISLAPEWAEPYRTLSDYYLRQGKIDKAIARIEALYKKHPSPPAIMNLAVLFEKKGQRQRADNLYEELLQRTKRSPTVMSDIAFLYAELRADKKDLERAAALAAEALARQPDNAVFLDAAAWVAFKQGHLDHAWEYLQQALARQPELEQINLHTALVANARGNKGQAVAYLERVMQKTNDAATLEKVRQLKQKWES